jgi:integrase
MLIEKGVDLAFIKDQLGHSSVVVTATVYAKLLQKRRPHVAAAVEARIGSQAALVGAGR